MDAIYLDNNSTTFLHPEVAALMADHLRAAFGNAASQHAVGRRTRSVIEDARDGIAEILGAATGDQLVFTSGGTESNNLAIQGLVGSPPASFVVSGIEHPSVTASCESLERRGFQRIDWPVLSNGRVDLARLPDLIRHDTRLVCLMVGNNETGVLQPVAETAQICRQRGVAVHTDAVQAVGKIRVDFAQLGATTLALTAHKFHGPRGIGALLVRRDVQLAPFLQGGFQQGGLRPGTEPVELISGLFAALRIWQREATLRQQQMTELRDTFECMLVTEVPNLVIPGRDAARLPHTSNVAFPGLDRQALVMALDLAGIACSTGSACASGSSEPSPVLQAMGLPRGVVDGALRFSLSAFTTAVEIEQATRSILAIYRDLQLRQTTRKPPRSSRQSPSDAL